jgi:hypothetical protein
MGKYLLNLWKWGTQGVKTLKNARKLIATEAANLSAKMKAVFSRPIKPKAAESVSAAINGGSQGLRATLVSYLKGAMGYRSVTNRNVGTVLGSNWNKLSLVDKLTLVWVFTEMLDSSVLTSLLDDMFADDANEVRTVSREISEEIGVEPGELVTLSDNLGAGTALIDADQNQQYNAEDIEFIMEAGDTLISIAGSMDQAEHLMAALLVFQKNPAAWAAYRAMS